MNPAIFANLDYSCTRLCFESWLECSRRPCRRSVCNFPFRGELCFLGFFISQFCIILYTNYIWSIIFPVLGGNCFLGYFISKFCSIPYTNYILNTISPVFVHAGPCMFIHASCCCRCARAHGVRTRVLSKNSNGIWYWAAAWGQIWWIQIPKILESGRFCSLNLQISPDSSIILKICQSAAHACNDE